MQPRRPRLRKIMIKSNKKILPKQFPRVPTKGVVEKLLGLANVNTCFVTAIIDEIDPIAVLYISSTDPEMMPIVLPLDAYGEVCTGKVEAVIALLTGRKNLVTKYE